MHPPTAPARRLSLLFALLVPAWISGCATTVAEREIEIPAPASAADGPEGPALDIENFRGTVEVRVNAQEDDIDVEAEVIADADLDEAQRGEVAGAVSIDAVMEDRGGLPVLVVRSTSARQAADHRVKLVIEMPACSGVRVRNAGGLVLLVGTAGAMQVDNTDGPIEVRTRHALTDPVALTTTAGGVHCTVPPGSRGEVTMESADGKVAFDGLSGATLSKSSGTAGKFVGTVNGGTNPVLLRTGSGFVRFRVVGNPESYVRSWH